MMRFRKFGLAGAAVLALALNGCGSSSEPMEPPPPPTAIETAEMALSNAEDALMAAEANSATTDTQLLEAQEDVRDAAMELLALLEVDSTTPHAKVDAVRERLTYIKIAITTTQGRISAAETEADAEEDATDSKARAETALSNAEDALMAAEANSATTDAQLLMRQKDVRDAAMALLALLQADADTPHGDVDAVRDTLDDIVIAIVDTTARINDAQKATNAKTMAIADARSALSDAKAGVAALDEDATNMEKLAAQMKVLDAAEALVAELGDTATDADTAEVTMAQTAIGATNERITTLDAAALAAAVSTNLSKVTGAPFRASETSGRNYAVGVARKSAAAAAVTVTDQNGTVMHTADDEELDAGDAPPHINKYWSGSGHQRGNEYVAVYTDIEAPTPIPFLMIELNGGRYTPSDVTGYDPNTVVQLAETNTPLSRMGGNPTVLEAAPTGTHTITFEDDDTTDNIDEDAFKGTYDGASGEFECTAASCTLTLDAKGTVTESTGTWVFEPDSGAMVDELDADYLWFGYWLRTAANDDGTYTYSFQADSDGTNLYIDSEISSIEGSATYVGAAGGMYMQKEVKTDGSFDPATGVARSGMFTATATLNANFGGDDVALDDQFEISGAITDFMDGEVDLGWTAKLMKVEFGSPAASTFDGMTEGNDSKLDHGEWNGAFYDNAPSDPAVDDNQPFGVAGEFNAHFSNGHAHGAYGASLVEE